MKSLQLAQAATVLAVLMGAAQAACLSDGEVQALFDSYNARQPAANPEGLSAADGACSRVKLLKLFDAKFGPPVRYKAGLTWAC
jgi:2-keto-4-pentenoate hydratase